MDTTKNSKSLTYKDAGVDIDAGAALVEAIGADVKRTHREGVLAGLGGFGGLFALDLARFHEPVLVSGTDGVGTKLMLARALNRHDTIGIDLVAMCVNDIIVTGAEPLFFLDYFATGALDVAAAADVIRGIAAGCEQSGCALIGGETAEMPGMYNAGEYDLAGFAVGAVNRSEMIDTTSIKPGQVVLGLRSSGAHSNGYSLIRKVIEVTGADLEQAFDGTTLGEALLAPTRIYVKSLLKLLQQTRVHALAHITGGGLLENIPRVLPAGCGVQIVEGSWQAPAIFDWLANNGNIARSEMLRTFNCGVGMIAIVDEADVEQAINSLSESGEQVSRIGRVVSGDGVEMITDA